MSNTTEIEESKLEHYFLSMYLVMAFILSLVGNSVVLYSSVSLFNKKDKKLLAGLQVYYAMLKNIHQTEFHFVHC